MPNNVLFPSNDPAKDFAHDNDNIDRGWVKIADNENLGTMAAAIPKEVEKDKNVDGNNDGNVAKKASNPKSIPSPIAHIKAFKNDLENNVPEVVNEWRGMLAAIALQKLQGMNISVKQIQLHTPNARNTGVLGEIVYESLIGNPKITGYTDERALDSLYVFCKDDKPFAMYMPSMVICPFKEYEKEIFNGLPWLEKIDREWVWKVVNQCQDMSNGNAISTVGVKLHSWLQAIHDTYKYNPIKTFYEDLEKLGAPGGHMDLVPAGYDTAIPLAGNNDPINKAAPSPDGAPETVFSDKLLFVVPPAVGSVQGNVDGDIDENGIGVFCPKKLSIEGNNVVYVVPPITDEVVQKLKAAPAAVAPQLVNKDWEITNDGNEKFVVKFQLFYPGTDETVTHSHEYSAQDVMWTSDMPYISMWPYVGLRDGLWKDYMVSLFVKRGKAEYGANAFSYKADLSNPITVYGNTPFIQGQYGENNVLIGEEVNGVTTTCMQIDVVAGQNANKQTFKCESSFRIGTDENQKFRIIKTESMPWAISFAYSRGNRTYTLGCWMIVPPPANNQNGGNQNVVAKIAMDFGTTSTNVFIRVGNNQSRSINSPSKYVHHIYNPLAGKEKIYQRYYLFGAEPDAQAAADGVQNGGQAVNVSLLGKIATYGQNLISVDEKENAATTGEPNIAGRFIEVDKEYMMSNDTVNDGIYNGLKWGDGNNQERDDARKNFISTLLNCAMLEARIAGATSVELGLSYPCESTNTAAQMLQQAVSGLTAPGDGNTAAGILRRNAGNMTITPYYETESKSDGKYFCDIFAPNNINTNPTVYPNQGYTVVDIGGGTTDISFWRGSANNPVEMKSQHSFLFAGSNIIERTFIDFFGDTANDNNKAREFNNFWAGNVNGLDRFITVQRDPNNPSYYYLRKSLVLNFLLEKSAFNTNAFGQLAYNNLFQAIRAKYYALFYLVASYLKADQVYNAPLPNNTSFCLAGCGSKGIRTFCCSTDTNFANNICELVKNFSYDIRNVYLVAPYTQNKEEVVIGLSKLDAGNNNLQPVVVAGGGATLIDNNDKVKDSIRRSLEELLDTIMNFEQQVPNAGDILQKVKNSFDNNFDTQYYNVTGMAVADTVESCAVMILDRMITNALA